jgi:hypothetical protein
VGWREAPGWWFKYIAELNPLQIPLYWALVRYVGLEAILHSGKRISVFCVVTLLLAEKVSNRRNYGSFRPTTPALRATPPGQEGRSLGFAKYMAAPLEADFDAQHDLTGVR